MRNNILLLCILLSITACGEKSDVESTSTESVSTAKSAIFSQSILGDPPEPKPSAALGVYSTYLLESEASTLAEGGVAAVETLRDLNGEDPEGQTEEKSYEILRSLGAVIQTDLIEVMNRSEDRTAALNTYLDSLKAVDEHGQAQFAILEADIETINDERKAVRKERSKKKREIKDLLKISAFEDASEAQKSLADIELKVAKVEAEQDRIKELIDQYENFLEISSDRIEAIESNREILISGLRVVQLPGIKDLKLIEKR